MNGNQVFKGVIRWSSKLLFLSCFYVVAVQASSLTSEMAEVNELSRASLKDEAERERLEEAVKKKAVLLALEGSIQVLDAAQRDTPVIVVADSALEAESAEHNVGQLPKPQWLGSSTEETPDQQTSSVDQSQVTGKEAATDLANALINLFEGTIGKIAVTMLLLWGIASGIAQQDIVRFSVGIIASIAIVCLPTLLKSTMQIPVTNEFDTVIPSFIDTVRTFLLVMLGPIAILVIFKVVSSIKNHDLDLVIDEERETQSNNQSPLSVTELQSRQEPIGEIAPSEPKIISQEAATTVEIKKNQRKIVLD